VKSISAQIEPAECVWWCAGTDRWEPCMCLVAVVRWKVSRTSTSTTGDNVMWRGLEQTNLNTWIIFVDLTEKEQALSPGSSLLKLFSRLVCQFNCDVRSNVWQYFSEKIHNIHDNTEKKCICLTNYRIDIVLMMIIYLEHSLIGIYIHLTKFELSVAWANIFRKQKCFVEVTAA